MRDLYTASDKEVLLAIPFFVMAGAIMTDTGGGADLPPRQRRISKTYCKSDNSRIV